MTHRASSSLKAFERAVGYKLEEFRIVSENPGQASLLSIVRDELLWMRGEFLEDCLEGHFIDVP